MRPLRLYTLLNQRRRRAFQPREQVQGRIVKTAFGLTLILALFVVASILLGALAYARFTVGLPSVETLPFLLDPRNGRLNQPTRVYDRSGEHLLYTLENPGVPRRWLPLESADDRSIAPVLAEVMIAWRDPDFWEHPGFSWRDLFDPAPHTLAERLADRFLLAEEAPSTGRALRMRMLAAQVTTQYGREQVLEWYLNSAALGHLTFGVDTAARLYLNRSAADLDLAGAVLIAALDEAPALNPLDAPQAALERQQMVLDRLLVAGAIREQDYLTARANPPVLMPGLQAPPQTGRAFAVAALNNLEERLGRERLEQGGLIVTTTLDYDVQVQVECAAQTQVIRLEGRPTTAGGCAASELLTALPDGGSNSGGVLASAAVLDLTTGEIQAYVESTAAEGETGYTGAHRPGSLLTPFVAVAGFARGMGPASLVWDIPSIDTTGANISMYRGPLRLRTALANDVLTPFETLLQQVGVSNVWATAEALGLPGLAGSAYPGDLLAGGGQAGLVEIAQAYGVFARLGIQVGQASPQAGALEPILVREVRTVDGQEVLSLPGVESRPVLEAPLAYLVHDILADNAARWSGLGYPDPLDIGRPSAAKVGTAENGREVWTVGYTPQRLTVAWLGLPDGAPGALEGSAAAGLWHAVQQYVMIDLPVVDWSQPVGISRVDVCDPSGLLPTAACPEVVAELFIQGTEPAVSDNLYRAVQVNRETGLLATVFTPPEMVEEETYLVVPPEAQNWAETTGLPQPPEVYDPIHSARSSPDASLNQPSQFAVVRGQVRLNGTAAGDDFASYRLHVGQGLNPAAWIQVGEQVETRVTGGDLGVWDTRGLQGLYAVRLQVLREDQRVDTAVIQVTVDNEPPAVQVVYPTAGEQTAPGANGVITFQSRLSDNLQVARVEWLVDGLVVGEQTGPPFSYPWQSSPGPHRLVVRASDLAGNETESDPVEFRVQ